jgi:uncharacterized protein (DUF1330 family)
LKKESGVSAYVVVQAEVIDWDRFKKYLKESPGTIARYGGKYIARGGETDVFEGDFEDKRLVLIEFPSLEKAREWYHSDEYREVKRLRKGAATGTLVAIEGC